MKTALLFLLALLTGGLYSADLAALFERHPDEIYFKDSLAMEVQVPADAEAFEILAAAEAVNRLCQERLELPERFFSQKVQATAAWTWLFRSRLRRDDPLSDAVRRRIRSLTPNQALVCVYSLGQRAFALVYGSGKKVLQASRLFFSRYPFLDELYGVNVATDLKKIQNDLKTFSDRNFRISGLVYDFPEFKDLAELKLERFRFKEGTVAEVIVESRQNDLETDAKLSRLAADRSRGLRTEILSYGEARGLRVIGARGELLLPRSGSTASELTPAYKSLPKSTLKKYRGRLDEILTTNGIFCDLNEDGFADALKSVVIVNEKDVSLDLITLSGLISSYLTGTTFPLFLLDDEVENFSELDYPVLIGPNNLFCKELLRLGKIPQSEGRRSSIRVCNDGERETPLLLINDREALTYLTAHFEQLQEFNWDGPTLKKSLQNLKDFFSMIRGGDVLYFYSCLKNLQAKNVNAYFSDFLTAEKIKAIFTDRLQNSGPASAEKTLKEWRLDLKTEKDRLLEMIEKDILPLLKSRPAAGIEFRVSESPAVRRQIENDLREYFRSRDLDGMAIQVNSAYKFAYFYILERFLPRLQGQPCDRLLISAPLLKDTGCVPRRFRQDPQRWLQELYPVDEMAARVLGLPFSAIAIEIDPSLADEYRLQAFWRNHPVADASLPIFSYQRPYLTPLPGWGEVTVSGGAVFVSFADHSSRVMGFKTDLEMFWDYYQQEVLTFLNEHIQKKTDHSPKLDKQPFFKQLKIEIAVSEPDFRTGLDEEIVSSLEAIHDEIYFDTLDFLSGILRLEKTDREFNLRKSSPGNVLPLIQPSSEGKPGQIKITLTDDQEAKPVLRWQENGRKIEKFLPDLKNLSWACNAIEITANGPRAAIQISAEKKSEYENGLAILESLSELLAQNKFTVMDDMFPLLAVDITCQESKRSFDLPTAAAMATAAAAPLFSPLPTVILPPEQVEAQAKSLSRFPGFAVFKGGESFAKRNLPVIAVFDRDYRKFSLNKMLLAKPTLFFSARQHSNEVSSSTYLLKTLEYFASTPEYHRFLKKMNIVALPMENPDGSELAFSMQQLTPFHSLHAGRYTAKGVDVGYILDDAEPAVPEARVRPLLLDVFRPDLYLNLHGYPSHEWVQPFSGYVPFLFRNYWIPKGMFLYFTYNNNQEKADFQKTGRDLLNFLSRELARIPDNEKFNARYRRWAQRWQPHLNDLEMVGASNIYHLKENPVNKKITPPLFALASEVPELMDETAQGPWLEQVTAQGALYLKAHFDFFNRLAYDFIRNQYQENNRVILNHKRVRPGKIPEH